MNQKVKEKFLSFFLNLKKIDNVRLLTVCASLTLIYLLSGYCRWIEIAVSVLAIAFMAVLPVQSSFCLFIFLHSFTLSNLFYNSCLVITFSGFTLILLVKFIIGVRKGEYKLNHKILFILSLFFGFSIILSLFRPIYGWSWLYPVYAILFYLIFAMRKEFDVVQAMNFMFGGILVSCSLSLICQFLPKFQYDIWFGGVRFMGFFNNPNTLYMRALFALSYYVYRFLNNKLSLWGFGLIYLLCASISILTQSKAGLISLALLTLIFLILFLIKDYKRNWKFVALFALLCGVACTLAWQYVNEVVKRLFIGFESENFLNTFLTGRDEIWILYFEEIFRNPFNSLFGKGVFTEQVFVASQFGHTETHNLYIFLLHRFGILGTAVLGYVVYLAIRELNCNKPKFINFLPLIYISTISLVANTMKCNNISYFMLSAMILFLDQKPNVLIENMSHESEVDIKKN